MVKLRRDDREEILQAIEFTGANTLQFPPDTTKHLLTTMPDWILVDIAYTLRILKRPGQPPPLPKRTKP